MSDTARKAETMNEHARYFVATSSGERWSDFGSRKWCEGLAALLNGGGGSQYTVVEAGGSGVE